MNNTQAVRADEVAKYGEHELNLTADANARLIAAAPELLAAAKEGLAALERAANGGLAYKITRNQLKAVIAKAEGN